MKSIADQLVAARSLCALFCVRTSASARFALTPSLTEPGCQRICNHVKIYSGSPIRPTLLCQHGDTFINATPIIERSLRMLNKGLFLIFALILLLSASTGLPACSLLIADGTLPSACTLDVCTCDQGYLFQDQNWGPGLGLVCSPQLGLALNMYQFPANITYLSISGAMPPTAPNLQAETVTNLCVMLMLVLISRILDTPGQYIPPQDFQNFTSLQFFQLRTYFVSSNMFSYLGHIQSLYAFLMCLTRSALVPYSQTIPADIFNFLPNLLSLWVLPLFFSISRSISGSQASLPTSLFSALTKLQSLALSQFYFQWPASIFQPLSSVQTM